MSNMAGKKKEDSAKVRTLREAVKDLPQRKKVIYAVFISIFVISLILLFVFTLLDAVTPSMITEEEFNILLPKLDDVEWKIKAGDAALIATELKSFKPYNARTEKRGHILFIILEAEGCECTLRFSYRDGRIVGFIGSSKYILYYSSGKRDSSKVLSLVNSKQKITLYEE